MEDIKKIERLSFPEKLRHINDPPDYLYVKGSMPNFSENKTLCVVGPRKYSRYAKEACERLISRLEGFPIIILSGLALGIDAIAHQSALQSSLPTLAVPGSGLHWDVLHPKTNHPLAKQILQSGGALVTEFEPKFRATRWSFPQRNRVMAGLSDAALIVEAAQKSGTLITVRLAMEYNRDVGVIPGSIFSNNTKGSNELLRHGATPITGSDDILEMLGIQSEAGQRDIDLSGISEDEKRVVSVLKIEALPKDELIEKLEINASKANILLSKMEIKGIIKESMGKISLT